MLKGLTAEEHVGYTDEADFSLLLRRLFVHTHANTQSRKETYCSMVWATGKTLEL